MRLIELHDTTKITWQQDRQAKRTRTVSLNGAGIPLDWWYIPGDILPSNRSFFEVLLPN